jgi:hypothetical protein
MARLFLAGVSVLLVGAVVLSQAQEQAAPPVKLEAGKAILREGERLILPRGTVLSAEHVKGEAELEVGFLRLIPTKKDRWEYEIRPVGRTHLRIKPAPGALSGVEVAFAGKRGQLVRDTTLGKSFTWEVQPYEIRDRSGKVVFSTKAQGN